MSAPREESRDRAIWRAVSPAHAGRDIELVAGPAPAGGHAAPMPRYCKLARLGYQPRVPLVQGLPPTLDWYWAQR